MTYHSCHIFNSLWRSDGAIIQMSSAYITWFIYWLSMWHPISLSISLFDKSSTYIENNLGDSVLPCLTLFETGKYAEIALPHFTHMFCISYQNTIILTRSKGTFLLINFLNKVQWFTSSNTLLASRKHVYTGVLSSV